MDPPHGAPPPPGAAPHPPSALRPAKSHPLPRIYLDLPPEVAALEVRPGAEGVFDWTALFGRAGPVEIEVGSGNGTFLSLRARQCPEANFLGVERTVRWLAKAMKRMAREGIANARFVSLEAEELFSRLVPPGTVRTVHIYFPDPWPKKRHAKRRLFKAAFLDDLARGLVEGGRVEIFTDPAPYAEEIRGVFATRLVFRRVEPLPPLREGGQSSYEAKFLREGRTIHRMAFEKRNIIS